MEQLYILKKKKMHLSCEIKILFKIHLCKLRVIHRSRVLRDVYTLVKDTGR